jgi:diamine N-acetyltransferase
MTDEVGAEATVSLREITSDTLYPILKLKVAPHQEDFVAPNAYSISEAHFSERAWFRAIYADETPVGFVMLEEPDPKAEAGADEACYFLWRLMIAADHQGKGFGRRAMALVIDHVRDRTAGPALFTSYVPEERGPGDFYRKLGFVETGEMDGGEVVTRLPL